VCTSHSWRALQVLDRGELGGPESGRLQLREVVEPVAKGGRRGARADLLEPAGECLRLVEREDLAARRIGIERVREMSLGACGFVDERERAFDGRRNVIRHALDVFCRLPGDAAEGLALFLRLDDAGGSAVEKEEVVGAPVRRLHDELADGDTL
jgi:hypothetical protein